MIRTRCDATLREKGVYSITKVSDDVAIVQGYSTLGFPSNAAI